MSEIKKMDYSGILGWSVSRYDKFSACKRQYFYDYYPKYDNEFPVEKLQFLKKLTSRALETGNIVHDLIKDILCRYQKSVKEVNMDKFFKYALNLTVQYCQKTFYESYYGNEAVLPEDIFAKVKTIMEIFFASKRFKWIKENALPESDKWIIEPDGYGETRIDGLKAYCKVDFLFPVGDKIYILDWKTGKPDEKKHSKQLTGYCAWASYHFEKEADFIFPFAVYLFPEFSERNIKIDKDSLLSFAESVRKETNDMYNYLTDIENNKPLDKKEFTRTDNNFCCKYCNYREICL